MTQEIANRSWLGRFLAAPRQIGSIAPSGPVLARAMVAQLPPLADHAVLELGPGGGVFTAAMIDRGIAPHRIVAVEYDEGMAAALRRRFPGVRVARGDAFDQSAALEQAPEGYGAVLSGLPLLNFPKEKGAALILSLIHI